MEKKEIFDRLVNSICEGDQEGIKSIAKEALDFNIDPLEVVEKGLTKGMIIVGSKFEKGEVFLPEMLIAADTFNSAMDIIKPVINSQGKTLKKAGKVLIGTVKGDVHNIGKNIVTTVLETNGFEVVDAGVDVQSLAIIEEAEKVKADIIALSALMTTSMPGQKEVIDILNDMGIRKNFFVIVGGGPVNAEWAEEIGADGYGDTAFDAVNIINKLISQKS